MDYKHLSGAQARQLIRSGEWKRPTTGLALGYVQANLVILPASWADEFVQFCHQNPQCSPLLDVTSVGSAHPLNVASDADLRTDIPRYLLYRQGQLMEEREEIVSCWQEDFVAFLLGCSFSAERALLEEGIRLRHLEQGKNVAMYRTTISCTPTARLHGVLVVSMRPIAKTRIERVVAITRRYPLAHGAPFHIGDGSALGIRELSQPDWGDPVAVEEDEVPVFWACGVTPQTVIMASKPEIALTHAPGHMFITDWSDSTICQR